MLIGILIAVIIGLIVLVYKFKPAIDIDTYILKRGEQYKKICDDLGEKQNEHKKIGIELQKAFVELTSIKEEISDCANIQEIGLHQPIFEFDDEEEYKEKLNIIRADEKWDVKNGNAIRCDREWSVGGSSAKGERLVKQYSKIMMLAFNSECDSLIAKVKYNNIDKFISRIEKSFKKINKFGELYEVKIHRSYLKHKLDELNCTYDNERFKQKKKEEEKVIKEKLRQEQAEIKALEAEKKKAELEEAKALKDYQNELKLLQKDNLNDKLQQRVEKLKLELENKGANVRKIAQAQLTKAGFVYIISNKSFNVENRYKIGLTRRLVPEDRVKELSNASVPFSYDIHAMIYADNAPELEGKLHKIFENRKVNKANLRKEFFDVELGEIEKEARSLGFEFDVLENPVNLDYLESINKK